MGLGVVYGKETVESPMILKPAASLATTSSQRHQLSHFCILEWARRYLNVLFLNNTIDDKTQT